MFRLPGSFGDGHIILGGVVIGICLKGIVKSVKRGIGQSGNHMVVSKAYRAEDIQGQNGNDQKEQIPGSWFESV